MPKKIDFPKASTKQATGGDVTWAEVQAEDLLLEGLRSDDREEVIRSEGSPRSGTNTSAGAGTGTAAMSLSQFMHDGDSFPVKVSMEIISAQEVGLPAPWELWTKELWTRDASSSEGYYLVSI